MTVQRGGVSEEGGIVAAATTIDLHMAEAKLYKNNVSIYCNDLQLTDVCDQHVLSQFEIISVLQIGP